MKKLIFSLVSASLLFFACGSGQQSSASFVVSPQEALVGSQITLDASASDGPITSFEWNFGDGTYGSGQVVNHIYVTAKLFTVTLTIRDSDGGTKTASQTVDIYRAGKKLILTKTYPAANSNPAIWVDSIYSEDPANSMVSIVIKQGNFYPDYISKNYTFWVSLPENLLEYSNYRMHDSVLGYYEAFVSPVPPRYFFLISSSSGPCIGGNGGLLILDLKLKELGMGSISLEEVIRRECWTNKKFDVAAYSANVEVKFQKCYD